MSKTSASKHRAGGVSKLFSGKVTERASKPRKQPKKRKPVDSLPEDLKELGDVFAAGKKVYKELDFKVRHAEYQVKDYCVRRFCEIYLATGNRPPSIEYTGDKSHFTFIQTSRINLTHEKVEALRLMDVPIDDQTELKGIDINYRAIQEHGLEKKLRTALENMGVSEQVLEECFVPKVQLKDTFFDHLDDVVKDSLGKNEDPAEKLYEVVKILGPANQVKNPDMPDLTPAECFKLVEESEISVLDIEDEDSEAA
jgi:hypothetical protein